VAMFLTGNVFDSNKYYVLF